jgi:hypothetical protein
MPVAMLVTQGEWAHAGGIYIINNDIELTNLS